MIDHAVSALADRARILVFTGAGISTESGIPDFRGPHGVWKRVDPSDYTYDRYLNDPEFRVDTWGKRFASPLLDATPNGAHHAVTRLWESGRVVGCVTQNIDGLHAAAGLGPASLVELHGNAHRIHCIICGDEPDFVEVERRWRFGTVDPDCLRCGGILKTKVVYFGEELPPQAMYRAWDLAKRADAVIVNRGCTDHDFRATALVDGAAGDVVPELVDRLTQD